jgi:phosphonate transport system substrate-binding protein
MQQTTRETRVRRALAPLAIGLMLTLVAAIACAPTPAALGTAGNPIKMSIVPFLETQRLVKGMQSLSDALEKETGLKYSGEVPTSYAAVIEAMCAGKVDIGWVSPLAYILGNRKCGTDMQLISVNTSNATTYRGMIIANAESPAKTLEELRGKKFAWVDPGSTSGYLFPRALFEEKGLQTDSFFSEQVFAGGHDKVVVAVVSKQVEAGAIFKDQRERMLQTIPNVMTATKVLAETPDIPNDGVAYRRGLPADIVDRTNKALLAISSRPDGKELFREAIGTLGVAPTNDATYEVVRRAALALKLDLETELSKPK